MRSADTAFGLEITRGMTSTAAGDSLYPPPSFS